MKEESLHITRKHIAALLDEVSDPEIPGISIVDLGMVVNITPENGHWRIDLATTYSGCPAIDVIPVLVKTTLQSAGFHHTDIRMIISPPWSTEWISDKGKRKLEAFGIASPQHTARMNGDEGRPKQCPQCGSVDVELISFHGSTPCKAAYKCRQCFEPFEYFKCH